MNCTCKKELIHSGDHDYEDYGYDGNGIVSNYSCPNERCDVDVIFVHRDLDKDLLINKIDEL